MSKFFKVYSGPGYPLDPKLEYERLHQEPLKYLDGEIPKHVLA